MPILRAVTYPDCRKHILEFVDQGNQLRIIDIDTAAVSKSGKHRQFESTHE